jgi:hypothetical protein
VLTSLVIGIVYVLDRRRGVADDEA